VCLYWGLETPTEENSNMIATLTEIAAYIFDTYGVRVGPTATGFTGRPVRACFGPVGAAVARVGYGTGFPKSGSYQGIAHWGTMRIARYTRAGNPVITRRHPLAGAWSSPGGATVHPDDMVLEVSDVDGVTVLVVDDGSTWGAMVRYEALDSPPCVAPVVKVSMNAIARLAAEQA